MFSSTRSGNGDLYLINADGTGTRRLTTSAGIDDAPTWSPDGSTRIAFTSIRGGNSDIYTVKADGTGTTRVTRHASVDATPDWVPRLDA